MAERNLSPNPCCLVNSTGWSAAGSTGATAARITGSGLARDTAFRLTNGSGAVTGAFVIGPAVAVAPAATVSVTMSGKVSVAATAIVEMIAYDSGGAVLSVISATATARTAGTAFTQVVTGTMPANTVTLRPRLRLTTSVAGGSTLMGSCVRVDLGVNAALAFADGDTTGWVWEGTAGSSSSLKVQAEQYGAAQVAQGTGAAVVTKPAGPAADGEPATLLFKGTSGTIVSAVVQRFRYVDPTSPLRGAVAFGGNTTAQPLAMDAPSVTWADRDALTSSWGLRAPVGTWSGPATMAATIVNTPTTGNQKHRAGSEVWSSGTTSGVRTATSTVASRFHSMSAAVRGAASGQGVELLLAHIYLDSNGVLGDLVLPTGWTLAGSAANATANTLVHAALAYKVVAATRTAITWTAGHAAPDVVTNGEFVDDSYQRQNNAGAFNDNTVPWPIPTLPASAGRPGRMIALSIPAGYRRYEGVPKHAGNDVGDPEQFFSIAVRLPPGFPIDFDGTFQIFDQLHHADDNWSPPVAFEARANGIRLSGGNGLIDPANPTLGKHDQQLVAAPTLGVWHRLAYKVSDWSESPNVSKISVWWDDVAVLTDWTLPCPTIVPHSNGVDRVTYRKVGIYRTSSNVTPLTIEQADHRAGATLAAVSPTVALSGTFTDCASDFTTDPTATWPVSYGATVAGGQLRISATNAGGGATTYSGRKTADQNAGARALTGAWIEVGQLPAADPGGAASPGMFWLQAVSQPAGTRVGWEYDPRAGTLTAASQVGYGEASPTVLAYSATAHRWWGVWIEATTTGYILSWQTSATGQAGTWVVQRTMAAPAWILGRDLSWSLETYRTGGVSDLFVVETACITPTQATYQSSDVIVSGSRVTVRAQRAVAIPSSPQAGADALQRRTLSELRQFEAWLLANNAAGLIGEFAVPGLWAQWGDPAQQAQWNALVEVVLGEIDRFGLHSTMWAAGPTWDAGYPLAVYATSGVGTPLATRNGTADTLAGHPSRNGLRHGLNLSGLEAGVSTQGGGTVRSSAGYAPAASDFALLAADGVDTVRLPAAHERLQPTLGGALSTTALAQLDTVFANARANNVAVIIDPNHNYARYTAADGTVMVLGGTLTAAHLVDFWTKFVTWLNADPARSSTVVALDIHNEPHDVVGGAATWKSVAQQILTAIRNAGDTRTVTIPGYNWSALTDWIAVHGPTWTITDPAQNVVFATHWYWDTQTDPSLGPRSGNYQQTKAGGGVETLTYARELAAAEVQTGASIAVVSGSRVAAAGTGYTGATASLVSGSRVAAGGYAIGQGATAVTSGSTVALAAPARQTWGAAAVVSGSTLALAPSWNGAASLVSGSRVTADPVKTTGAAATLVSGSVVVVPDVYATPAVAVLSRSGSQVTAAPLQDIGVSAAVVSGSRTTADTGRSTPASCSMVSGSVVGAAPAGGGGVATSLTSGSRVGAAVSVGSNLAATLVSGGTVAGGVINGTGTTASLVSGSRVTASTTQTVVAFAAILSGSVVRPPDTANRTGAAASLVSGSQVTATTVVVGFATARRIVSGSRVGALGGIVKVGAGVLVSGSTVTAAAQRWQPLVAGIVSGSVVRANAASPFRPLLVVPPGPVVTRVPELRRRVLVADTRTGRIHYELPHTALSWDSKINDDGAGSATVRVEDTMEALYEQGENRPGRVLREILTGGFRYSLAMTYGPDVLWGGPIKPARSLSTAAVEYVIGAKEFSSIFLKRLLVGRTGTAGEADASRDVTFAQTNDRYLALLIVAHAIAGTGRELPITCTNPPREGGNLVQTFLAYDRVKARDALAKIAEGDTGPDLRFDPYLVQTASGQRLYYDLKIGRPFLDFGREHVWDDVTTDIELSADVVGLATTLDVIGGGQDRDKLITRVTDDTLVRDGFPVLEDVDTTQNSLEDPYELRRYAAGAISTAATPTETWTLKVPYDQLDGIPRTGHLARIEINRSALLDRGQHRQRIASLSGDASETLSVTVDAGASLQGV